MTLQSIISHIAVVEIQATECCGLSTDLSFSLAARLAIGLLRRAMSVRVPYGIVTMTSLKRGVSRG
jgi:hypothetical protein